MFLAIFKKFCQNKIIKIKKQKFYNQENKKKTVFYVSIYN